jgi:uncharacterized protein
LIVLDTSALFAALVPDQAQHDAARGVLLEEPHPRLLSPFVLAELAYLLATRGGPDRELAWLEEVAREAYELAAFGAADVALAAGTVQRYRHLGIGLTDASVAVLADRFRTNRIFTLDERHFRAMQPLAGGHFELLPADV